MRTFLIFLTDIILIGCFCLVLTAANARAATLTVTKTADTKDGACDADCSLREAIIVAAPGDEIVFASPLFDSPQTVNLSAESGFQALLIEKNLTITGKGANLLTVRRPAAAPPTALFRIFEIGAAAVNISGLTVTGGLTNGDAGGISAFGSTLTITGCVVTGNTAANRGGGIRSIAGGTLTVINSTISNNTSNHSNPGSGGVYDDNNLTLINSTVSGNVKNNGNNNGGGVWASGTVLISNSTVTNNRADGAGSASGVYRSAGAMTIRSSIIAANQNNSSTPDAAAAGTITSGGYNLIGSTQPGSGFADGTNHDKVGTISTPLDPRLDALGSYGGTTPTHRLQANSPAIDKGGSFGQTIDQRGNFRIVDNTFITNEGDGADIGAYELAATLIVTSTADTTVGACDADCTLREAIAAAGAGNTIEFSSLFDAAQVITLSEAIGFRDLVINKTLTINGKGANLLTIRRDANSAVFFRIFTVNSQTLALNGATVTGGKAGGSEATSGGIAAFQNANLTINACHITDNEVISASSYLGGGISIYSNGTLTITNSTISGNTVGLDQGGSATAYNGGGIFLDGSLTLIGSTVTDNGVNGTNSASGIYNNGALIIGNTIVAGNRSNSSQPDFFYSQPSQVSRGFNVIGSAPSGIGGFNQSNDQIGTTSSPIDPLLKPLTGNGGTTPTHALSAGSPALDKGFSFGNSQDQRGTPRPFDNPAISSAMNGDGSDIGAFEAGLFPPIVVTKVEDTNDGACDSDCSLREAIAASASGNQIIFASPLFDTAQTITLSESTGFGELFVAKSLTITGKGADRLTIRRHPTATRAFRIFHVADATLTLTGMTVTGGLVALTNPGGGIYNNGDDAVLIINACHITGNSLIRANTVFAGGGIANPSGKLFINNSTVSNNVVQSDQGAAGGGIYAGGETIITNSTISGNTVAAFEGSGGDRNGGGIYAVAGATLRNTTVTDNGAAGANSGSGIYVSLVIRLGSTLVAANRNNQTQADVAVNNTAMRIVSQGFNLIGSAAAGIGFNQSNDQVGTVSAPLDPRLNILANYGGKTPTHSLTGDSPATDKGNSFGLTADQRGLSRPVDLAAANVTGGDGSDIGAFEIQVATAASVTVSGRVLTPDGGGLRNARVTLTNAQGNSQTVLSGVRGAFRFAGVAAGETYILSVAARRYVFAPQVVFVGEDLDNLIFNAAGQSGGVLLP